ncbi:hypothetical protein PRIPAC_80557 [Pristionchus pacificus]|uniref:CX domain-containing protein n=1 Tax=Pristionchus pacificus TaxID=54126 RepID=A0A454XV66_PRIPA|nr:hypothetical protein PRIPAC_80557 [Pristionchus pacificus]|eukprot:PDM72581.1 hypothetical protein PRIPAC_39015 [Pristionchus pacificus]
MRIILTLLPLLSLIDGKGGVGGGRGASGARGASAGARGASSASRGASASASRPSGSYSAPRVVNTPVRSPSRSSLSGSSALLGFGAGALAGSLTSNRINNAYAPVSYGGNNYYWSRDVVPQDAPNVCSRPLTDIDASALEDVMFQDGTSPSEFAWMCSSSEMCCDWSCCEDNGRSSIAVARRSFSDPTDSTDSSSTLTPLSSLSSDSTTDTNNEDDVIPVEEGIAQDDFIYSEEYSYRGSIAGWIILGIAIAALIFIIGCIGVFTVKRRRKAAQLSWQRRVVQQSQLPRDDPWTPDLPPSHRTPPVFTSPVQGVPPSYSNIVHAAPMPKSTLPEKPPAYSTQ